MAKGRGGGGGKKPGSASRKVAWQGMAWFRGSCVLLARSIQKTYRPFVGCVGASSQALTVSASCGSTPASRHRQRTHRKS